MNAEELWERGCLGADLSTEGQKQFAAMARSRFHTFQLGIDHASKSDNEDGILGLIKGMAIELKDRPGLRKIWSLLAVSKSEIGEQVSLQLEKLDQGVIH
jgi:hypothetical protein